MKHQHVNLQPEQWILDLMRKTKNLASLLQKVVTFTEENQTVSLSYTVHMYIFNPRRHKVCVCVCVGGGGVKLTPPPDFFGFNFCSLSVYQKLWYNCSLFITTCFDNHFN